MERLKGLASRRVVLVTGKGGVGKTTVAASLARYVARQGQRVLAAELSGGDATDVSALATALGVKALGDEPVAVAANLSAVALSPTAGHARFLRDVMPVRVLADAAMRSSAIRRFLMAAPTFPEMGALYRLLEFVRARRRDGTFEYATIVVDLPATGHALALAQIPSAILKVIPTGPIAAAVREGLDLLTDTERTAAVVVTLPETLPISEALELLAGIEVHRVPVANVFVNRVPYDPFSDEEREAVRRLLGDSPPVLGERTMERIDRARVALERLVREVKIPIVVLQDVWLDGPKLTEEMASLMAMEVPS